MIEYDVQSPVTEFIFSHAYAARITGPDPNYILHREFQRAECYDDEYGVTWCFDLDDGIYEIAVTLYDRKTGEKIHMARKWVVIFRDIEYEYDFDEMNAQYVLYTVHCIRMQNQICYPPN